MMISRKAFIRRAAMLAGGVLSGGILSGGVFSSSVLSGSVLSGGVRSGSNLSGSRHSRQNIEEDIIPGDLLHLPAPDPDSLLTLLYTNDTHSRIDPFPETAVEYAGLGGIAQRAHLVNEVRKHRPHVILLDAGDVFQGTPWFRLYGGEVDFRIMTEMGYDAMTLGNHEFDLGIDHLAAVSAHAGFPLLAANYNTHQTALKKTIRPLTILKRGSMRIGVFGLGVGLHGVVKPELHGDVSMYNTITRARMMAKSLRSFHKCDLVICLSHLGYQYQTSSNRPQTPDDRTIAQQVEGIDIIIGGHTHTFLEQPEILQHPSGQRTLITQMGHSGVRLGHLELNLETWRATGDFQAAYYEVGTTVRAPHAFTSG